MKQISNVMKAGNLMMVLGAATILITVPVLLLIIALQKNMAAKIIADGWLIAAIIVATIYAISAVIVGKKISGGSAEFKNFGIAICMLSVICFIFGIPIGLLALWFLLQGGSDSAMAQ